MIKQIARKTITEIKDIAKRTLQNFFGKNTIKIPIDIDLLVEKDFNIQIVPFSGLKRTIGSFSFLSISKKYILIDSDFYWNETNKTKIFLSRFAIAHELGHYILHSDSFLQDVVLEDINDYDDFLEKLSIHGISNDLYNLFEREAHEFAGNLLIPKDDLINKLSEIFQNKQADYNKFKERNYNEVFEVEQILSQYFQVSLDVIRIRLNKENAFNLVYSIKLPSL